MDGLHLFVIFRSLYLKADFKNYSESLNQDKQKELNSTSEVENTKHTFVCKLNWKIFQFF